MADKPIDNSVKDAEIRPYIRALVKKATEMDLCITGFIYSGEPEPFLTRFGNIYNTGWEFVQIHGHLAAMAEQLRNKGNVTVDNLADEPNVESSSQIADKLAVALLATPLENIPAEVQQLLDRYLESRKIERV